jgi:hypothetical protein
MRQSLVDLPVSVSWSRDVEGQSQAFWQVDDVEADVAELRARGVIFEEYDFPGLKTLNGVAMAGDAKAAWFKDSEGNILAVIQALT